MRLRDAARRSSLHGGGGGGGGGGGVLLATAAAAMTSEGKAAAALSNGDLFLLGAFAKVCSTLVTFPIQTVKTSLAKAHGVGDVRFGGVFGVDCVRHIVATEGIGGLYAGVESKLVQTSLTAAVLSVVRLRILAFLVGLSSKYA